MTTATVLLADDNPAILDYVRKLLEQDNDFHVVAAARDGASALYEYGRNKPDVLILDISMEPVGGIELARQLRDGGCHAKIIFLTVHEDPDYLNAAMGAGGSAYIVKPRLNTDLIPAIRAVLDHKLFISPSLLEEPAAHVRS